jgi:putative ABC transport system permease protein
MSSPQFNRLLSMPAFSLAGWPRMVPLAWYNVTSDFGRMARAAGGIAFAVLLMLTELGFRQGFFDAATAIIEALDADIVLINPQKIRFGAKEPFARAQLYQAAGVPGVASVKPMYGEWRTSIWKNPQDHHLFNIQVLAFDPDQSVWLLPAINSKLEQLKLPDTVLADAKGRRFLGRPAAGQWTELSYHRVRIVGTFNVGPDFTYDGTIIMSDRNFLKYFSDPLTTDPKLDMVEFGIVKVTLGANVQNVQAGLQRIMPADVRVLTKQEFFDLELDYQSGLAPVGPIFGLGALFGFLVGTLITYQILFADLSDQLPQYATLKAMGYGRAYIVKSVLQQSAFYGLVGYLPSWLLAILLYAAIAQITLLPLGMTIKMTALSLGMTLGMCLISGAVVVRRVLQVDPAELFV